MYRNWYSININNSKVRLTTDSNATELVIPSSNYRTYGDIVAAFAEQVRAQAFADAVAQGSTAANATVVDLFPVTTTLVNSTSDRIMSFNILFDQPHTLTTSACKALLLWVKATRSWEATELSTLQV